MPVKIQFYKLINQTAQFYHYKFCIFKYGILLITDRNSRPNYNLKKKYMIFVQFGNLLIRHLNLKVFTKVIRTLRL